VSTAVTNVNRKTEEPHISDETWATRPWVGNGAKVASDGKTLVSADGLRQYRPPEFKPNLGKVQANFEARQQSFGQWLSNGHLDVK
jgi:filamentous hemagglutinin